MYPRYIEVHLADDGTSVMLNTDNIIGFANTDNNGAGYAIKTVDNGEWYIKETYDEIKHMITEAGCHIEKGDPRLDTTRPVSWDELTMMENIGQPLFNSNTRRWMLLIDSDSFRTSITLLNDQGGQEKWIEHDIVSKPLYRMRREK